MRPIRLCALVLVSSLAVAACGGAAAGWTYAPAPSVTPVPSAEASDGASPAPSGSGGASAAPSGSAGASAQPSGSAGASAQPSGSAGGSTVSIAAAAIAFVPTTLSAAAGAPFSLEFDNQDAGTPHNVAIKDGAGAQVFITDTFPGPEKRTFEVPALTAGSYPFVCTVHPNMTGTLTVQ